MVDGANKGTVPTRLVFPSFPSYNINRPLVSIFSFLTSLTESCYYLSTGQTLSFGVEWIQGKNFVFKLEVVRTSRYPRYLFIRHAPILLPLHSMKSASLVSRIRLILTRIKRLSLSLTWSRVRASWCCVINPMELISNAKLERSRERRKTIVIGPKDFCYLAKEEEGNHQRAYLSSARLLPSQRSCRVERTENGEMKEDLSF